MALINHRTREIHFKIVYYGCGLCGKTTNLKVLHDRLPAERRGRMISIATDQERTLFFDFLPIDLGQVNGFLTRFHLYTVPGQVYYKLSRRAVLQGVDGLVFVADSHPAREQANRESLADLHEHLRTLGITGPALARVPWVFQYNKRDAALPIPLERLRAALNPHGWPEFEAVASDAKGVSETLRAACKAVLARLASSAPAPARPSAPAPPSARPAPSAPAPPSPSLSRTVVAPGSAAAPAPARPSPSAAPTASATPPRPQYAPTPLQPLAARPAAAPVRISRPRPTAAPLRPGGAPPARAPMQAAPPPGAPRPPLAPGQTPGKPRPS